MELTPSEREVIQPGIYRFIYSHINGVPGIRDAEFDGYDLPTILEQLIAEDCVTRGHDPQIVEGETYDGKGAFLKRKFFSDAESFFDAWQRGYETGHSQFGSNSVYDKQGFELSYVNWHTGSNYFEIGSHKGIKMIGDRADLNPILIAADNNGMNDQRGYLNLGVNEFHTLKVLVYRKMREDVDIVDRDAIVDLSPEVPKPLRNDLHYYVWPGQDRFPFEEPNIIKSMNNQWTAVGISPLEVYAAIQGRGFEFPK